MIKLYMYDFEHIVKPTLFSDGTSQVWELPEKILNNDVLSIQWLFENESEIFHLMQIVDLYDKMNSGYLFHKYLTIPYLPYARQDKDIGNGQTFSLHTFSKIINSMNFNSVTSQDVHNPELTKSLINNFNNQTNVTFEFMNHIFKNTDYNVVCYPDDGAFKRYKLGCPWHQFLKFEKIRNQMTGQIESIRLDDSFLENDNLKLNVLIVDDICDGGRTFLECYKLLVKNLLVENIGLFVTHGVFKDNSDAMLLENGFDDVFSVHKLKDFKNVSR